MFFNKKDKKLRIGILGLAAKPIPPENICAPNSIIFELAKGMKEQGHEVTIFTGEDSSKELNKISADLHTTWNAYGHDNEIDPVVYTQRRIEYDLILAREAIKSYKAGKLDVINSHDFRINPYLFSEAQVPVLYMVHGDLNEDILTEYDHYRLEILRQKLFGMVVMSGRNKDFCQRSKIAEYGFVPNGIDVGKYQFNETDRKGLLIVGRIIPFKMTKEAIEIAGELGEEVTVIGAPGPTTEDKKYFEELEKDYFSRPYVKYLGFVPQADIIQYYQKAKLMIHPTNNLEGMPMVILEAMATGLPVAATRIGGIADIITDGEDGILFEVGDDVATMAKKARLGFEIDSKKPSQKVVNKFSREAMVNAYLAAYQKFMITNPPRK